MPISDVWLGRFGRRIQDPGRRAWLCAVYQSCRGVDGCIGMVTASGRMCFGDCLVMIVTGIIDEADGDLPSEISNTYRMIFSLYTVAAEPALISKGIYVSRPGSGWAPVFETPREAIRGAKKQLDSVMECSLSIFGRQPRWIYYRGNRAEGVWTRYSSIHWNRINGDGTSYDVLQTRRQSNTKYTNPFQIQSLPITDTRSTRHWADYRIRRRNKACRPRRTRRLKVFRDEREWDSINRGRTWGTVLSADKGRHRDSEDDTEEVHGRDRR